jgi:uncharacterized membrane protein YidH (DUF202 family)
MLGILLILFAIITFAYAGVTYTTREKVVDLGPLQVTKEKVNTLPVSPVIGIIALVAGAALLGFNRSKA